MAMPRADPPAPFVELGVATPFLLPARRVGRDRAGAGRLRMGMDAIGVADRNTLAGVVRMHSAARARDCGR